MNAVAAPAAAGAESGAAVVAKAALLRTIVCSVWCVGVGLFVRVRACVHVCVCVCVRACVRARTRMRACAHEHVPLAHEVRTGASWWICRQSHHEPARNGPCPFANKCLAGDPAGGALHPFAVASIHCAAGGPPPGAQ